MASIFPGRSTAQSDEPFVVFLIGMDGVQSPHRGQLLGGHLA